MKADAAVLERLKEAQVRPADLAKALNVSRPLASLMLRGKRGIPTWHLDAIAILLETDVPSLFSPSGEKKLGVGSRDPIGQSSSVSSAAKPEGTRDAKTDRGPTTHRLSESEAAFDAEMQRQFTEEREALERQYADTLDAAAENVRYVANALRRGGTPPPTGNAGPDHLRGDRPPRRPSDRRGRRK